MSTRLFIHSLRFGDRGDDVSNLQAILSIDPSIYPERIIIGNFSLMTENAIRRLQQKYDLTVTGILDAQTQEIIFPSRISIDLRVISPNDGEVWSATSTQTQTIS